MSQAIESLAAPATPFHSILFGSAGGTSVLLEKEAPACFGDLNLDQIVGSITAGRDEYDLKPFFYTPLTSVDAIGYRHEVLRDLENEILSVQIRSFAQKMREMRTHLVQAEKLRYKYQKESWFLAAVAIYGDAASCLVRDLSMDDLRSRGLLAFREYLTTYVQSAGFTSLVEETKRLTDELSAIRYCLDINGNRIKVTPYDSEADYSAVVERTFEKFKQGAVDSHLAKFLNLLEMNHVEAGILSLVAELYPDIFQTLGDFRDRHSNFLDQTVMAFDREVQFYVSYLEYLEQFRESGLTFCYPRISDSSKAISCRDAFDLALAKKLMPDHASVVPNDFYLEGGERILVVSGANQGGKTTFARAFGQVHYLASLGVLVPGRDAQLFLFDRLFTHFEKEEDLHRLSGKLEDDLIRAHKIFAQATGDSILIMNEIFTSTTLKDAVYLGTEVMRRIIRLGMLCVCVTFVDELSSLSEETVSLVASVAPNDPVGRTYKIVRRPADGLAYAAAIAKKYGLAYETLKERIAS